MQMSARANTPSHATLTLGTGFVVTVSYLRVKSDTYSVAMTWKIRGSVDSGRYKLVQFRIAAFSV
jgi:hypothetical protein